MPKLSVKYKCNKYPNFKRCTGDLVCLEEDDSPSLRGRIYECKECHQRFTIYPSGLRYLIMNRIYNKEV